MDLSTCIEACTDVELLNILDIFKFVKFYLLIKLRVAEFSLSRNETKLNVFLVITIQLKRYETSSF